MSFFQKHQITKMEEYRPFKCERFDLEACFLYCSSLHIISQSEKIRKFNALFL